MSQSSELVHLFRELKAPAAARALPKLAERARSEEWSYERFAQALLSTEVSAREAHGGEGRIRSARFPARKTLEEFDFTFQRSVKKTVIEHLGQLDFLTPKRTSSSWARPGPARHTSPSPSASEHASPGNGSSSKPPPNGLPCSQINSAKAASTTNSNASSATPS